MLSINPKYKIDQVRRDLTFKVKIQKLLFVWN